MKISKQKSIEIKQEVEKNLYNAKYWYDSDSYHICLMNNEHTESLAKKIEKLGYTVIRSSYIKNKTLALEVSR